MVERMDAFRGGSADASADIIVDCSCQLHLKLTQSDDLFDPSWECSPVRLQDRLRWADRLFHASSRKPAQRPLFEQVIERLILLKPIELQRLLCAISLLARRDDLRRCIDGTVVRVLQAVVGTNALAAILRSRRLPQTVPAGGDLSVPTLVAQGFSRLAGVYSGEWTMVLQCLRLALPVDLLTVSCADDETTVDNLLREAHAWYPELTWLYG